MARLLLARFTTVLLWLVATYFVLQFLNFWLLLGHDCADMGLVISEARMDCTGPDRAGLAAMQPWQHRGFWYALVAVLAAVLALHLGRRYRRA